MTHYRIVHRTTYEYEVPVIHAHHVGHLRPRSLSYQKIRSSDIVCEPQAHAIVQHTDYFGNGTQSIEVLERHDSFQVTATSRVEVEPRELATQTSLRSMSWSDAKSWITSRAAPLEAEEFVCDSPFVRAHTMFKTFAAPCFPEGRSLIDAVTELNEKIFGEFTYETASTTVSTPLAQVMRERRGVCQDFAHVAVACLRTFGLAARYVSGYLETVPPPGVEKLVGVDASHAWFAVLIPEVGWLELDPTNGILPKDRHITLGWGRDFSDVTPLKGVVLGGGLHSVRVGVDVEQVRPGETVRPEEPSRPGR